MKNFILILILISITSCDNRNIKTNDCEYSILYEFVGFIHKDSIRDLPTDIDVFVMNYDGVLTIHDCTGKADLRLMDKHGDVVVKGSFLGGAELEKIESEWVTSDIYSTKIDTIEIYKTFIDGDWNFKRVKVKTGGDLIE